MGNQIEGIFNEIKVLIEIMNQKVFENENKLSELEKRVVLLEEKQLK